MRHQKVSLECHAVYKNAVNLGVQRSRNSIPGGTVSSEEGRGSGCAWGKPRCLAFWKVFGLVLVRFCWGPVSVPTRAVFSVASGQGHFWRLNSPLCTFVAFVGRSIFPFSPQTVPLQCWLPCGEGSECTGTEALNANDKVLPKSWVTRWAQILPGPCLESPTWTIHFSVGAELSGVKSWLCPFPQTLQHFSPGSSLF